MVVTEASVLATEAELDVGLVYEIVCAAGNSWMFGDRGKRMIADGGVDEGGKKKVTSFHLVTLLHITH